MKMIISFSPNTNPNNHTSKKDRMDCSLKGLWRNMATLVHTLRQFSWKLCLYM